ncbi:PHB depolymerase family esterase [Massilia sp. METH4]|uniref:extracellular catalytic domain type 1 short-chain-length polyhydroxyalkanoate depolymerase n=1 Tax=Massilia sp. METH4 TaxID=3123041 RepID=UPI0030CAA450
MKFDSALMARLQAATQDLMKDGPLSATAAIQRALAGDDAPAAEPPTKGAQPGATMKDLNPPPEKPQPRRAPWGRKAARADDPPPQGATQEQPGPKSGIPDMADMLAKAGITLPEGFADSFKEKFKGGLQGEWQGKLPEGLLDNLPEALKNANLPGGRKRPPPPPLPDGARFDSASYTCSAGTRGYKLYVPSTYKCDGQPVSLVVMLHGCTQDPDDFAAGTRMNQVAEETGCLVAYPAQSQQANSSKCWNWFSAADQRRDQGEPAIIAGIARQVMAEYKVDTARVGIAGLSAGGAMAVVVGSLYPELFKAVGVHSGLPFGCATDLPSALQAMQKGSSSGSRPVASPPLIVFHGDKDRTVHPKNGSDVLAHGLVGQAGAAEVQRGKADAGRKYTRTVHRAADGRVLAEHWELHGAGHAWAGGSASGSYTDPTGPDASREMVRFFSQVAGA